MGICKKQNIPLINIVRRQEQAEILKEMGSEHIINSSEEGWEQKLEELAKKLKATFCLECIAGEISGKILSVLPYKTTMIAYGALSGQALSNISPSVLIRGSRIEGFYLTDYMATKSVFQKMALIKNARLLMQEKTFHTKIAARVGLEGFMENIQKYEENMTAGKYIVYPNKEQE